MRYPKEKQTTEAKALAPPEIGSFTTVVNTYFKSNILAKAARPHGGCVFISASGISPASVIL